MAATKRDSQAYIGSGSTMSVDIDLLSTAVGDAIVVRAWGYESIGVPTGSGITFTEAVSELRTGEFGGADMHKAWVGVRTGAISDFTMTHGVADVWAVVVDSVQGADTTTPLDDADVASNWYGTVTDPSAPSLPAAAAGSLLLTSVYSWPSSDVNLSFTHPSGMTPDEMWESWDAGATSSLELTSAGATGAKTYVESPSMSSSAMVWICSSIAIRAADTGAPVSDDGLLNPYTDVSNAGAWVTDSGGTSSLYAAIDEDSLSDTDFIQSPVGPSTAVYEVALEDVPDPGVNTGHVVHYRYAKSVGADTVDLTVALYQGATLIDSWTHTNIGTTLTTVDQTLSGAEADSIVATGGFYTDLRLRFTANMTAGGGTPALVADRDTENSNSGVATVDLVLTGLTVGNVLVIRTAADNSGGGGSARSCTPSNQSGSAMGTVFGNYQRNYDPGAASAGTTCNVIVAPITATSGTVRLTYGGSVVQAAVAEEWSGVDSVTPVIGTPVGNDGAASTNLASLADASVAEGNCAYGVEAVEGPSGDTYTQDADTTNGSWSSLTKVGTTNGTADTNQTTYGGYKVVSAAGGQTYNPTIAPARDSAGLILELAKAPPTARAKVTWAQFEVPFTTPLAESITDDFDDNDIDDAKWFASPTYVVETSQLLQITPTTGYPALYSLATVALTGSYAYAKVPTVPNMGNGTTSAGLFFHVDTDNRVGVLWTADGLKMFERLVGSDTWLASVTYSAVTHLWWRVRAVGTTVYWDTSVDGVTWTNRHSKDYSASPSMDLDAGVVYLEAGFYGTEPSPGVAQFDNLNVAPTSALAARRVMAKTAGGLVEINVRAWTGAAAVSSTARSG